MKKPLSHSEILALHDQLLLKSRTLSAALESATGKKIAEPTISYPMRHETILAEIDSLEAHCEKLQTEINAAVKPAAIAAPVTASASPTVAPVTTQPVKNPTNVAEKKSSYDPDAEILKARGVRTYDELETSCFVKRNLGLLEED